MNKKLLTLLLILVLSMTSMPVAAAGHSIDFHHGRVLVATNQLPVVYEGTITVTDEGGKFRIGFVTLEFRKDFLDDNRLPATFNVRISVKDGEAGIEINPSTNDFQKKVLIKVDNYNGLLYDEEQGQNIKVDIKNQVIFAEHFSWYRFR